MAELTMWQATLQSYLCHPTWTPKDHLEWLQQEDYDTTALEADPNILVRWLESHRRSHPIGGSVVDEQHDNGVHTNCQSHDCDTPGVVENPHSHDYPGTLVCGCEELGA